MRSAPGGCRAYAEAARATATPRSIEHRIFSEITARLQRFGEDPLHFADLTAAIHDNLALWSAIIADVADAGNQLPQELRARLLYLGEFSHLHSRKVLKGDAAAAPLIDINRAVMRGLRGAAAA